MKLIRIVVAIISMTVFSLASAAADEAQRGQVTGGQIYELPDWFKKSFLVLHEDVEEAKA